MCHLKLFPKLINTYIHIYIRIHTYIYIYIYILLKTKYVLIIDKYNIKRMRNLPHEYKPNKKPMKTSALSGDLYKKNKKN